MALDRGAISSKGRRGGRMGYYIGKSARWCKNQVARARRRDWKRYKGDEDKLLPPEKKGWSW